MTENEKNTDNTNDMGESVAEKPEASPRMSTAEGKVPVARDPAAIAAKRRRAAKQGGGRSKQSAKNRPNPQSGKRRPPKGQVADNANPNDTDENLGSLGAVVLRNEFYRDGYRSLLRLAIMQSVVIIGLIGVMFFVVNIHQPENRFFATTEDGRLIPMVPMSQPNLSTPALMSWVAQSVVEVMTFGFSDYRRRLQESSRNFTKTGWESFTTALDRSRIIEMVEQNQQVVTAAPAGAPIIQSEGVVMGRYQWRIQVPITLTYQAGSRSRSTGMLVTLLVVRVPRLENPNGIGIEQWIAVAR